MRLTGTAVSPGLSEGTAFIYVDVLQRDAELIQIEPGEFAKERARIEAAIEDVRASLSIDSKHIHGKLGKMSADIFVAQSAILSSSMLQELKDAVGALRVDAEQTVRAVFGRLAGRFRALHDEVLRERADDVEDLSRRLLLSLAGIHAHSLEDLPPRTVLVARRLLPSDTVFLSRSSTVAVLAEFAGRAGHAALLARELGIPCIGGISKLLEKVHHGDRVLVDGTHGIAVTNPDAGDQAEHQKAVDAEREHKRALRSTCVEAAVTLDGVEIAVMANVRSREDVSLALDRGADGVGLFRTEPFFLSSKHLPSHEEFAEFLLDALARARGRRIDVRLLDVGADKNPIYMHLPPETDPFLGRRGVRVLREYPELLDAQLRAMLEVSRHFPIGILIPMVTTDDDVAHVAGHLQDLASEMAIHSVPRLGAMIETPAAALCIASLRQQVDFFSIGSNDLTQYTMAAGRENPMVAKYFVDEHPSVLRLIELVVRESEGQSVSLCGELACRTAVMEILLRTGIRSLSVPAALVPDVKDAIRSCRIAA